MKREVVELPRTLLVIYTLPWDNDNVITRAIKVIGLVIIVAIPVLLFSWCFLNLTKWYVYDF